MDALQPGSCLKFGQITLAQMPHEWRDPFRSTIPSFTFNAGMPRFRYTMGCVTTKVRLPVSAGRMNSCCGEAFESPGGRLRIKQLRAMRG